MSFFRILRYGIQGFRRNIWLSVIAIITMTMTITTVVVFVAGNVVAAKKYQEFNDKLDYFIFIKDEASDADVQQLRSQIEGRSEVIRVTYLDKDAALKNFEENFGTDDSLKGAVSKDDNPLPREIDVKFKDPSTIDQFDQFIKQDRFQQLVEFTSYHENGKAINAYVSFTNFFRVFGLGFTIFFIMIALLVILNTVRLAIYSRREEVEIMRLVGATRGYIRGPFLIEGMLFGLLGALFSAVVGWIFLRLLQTVLARSYSAQTANLVTDLFGSSFANITTIHGFNSVFAQLFLLQVATGLVLGVACSYAAIRRYLKE
jgi:cell division transport system permease protein